jgi:hypothetical protein
MVWTHRTRINAISSEILKAHKAFDCLTHPLLAPGKAVHHTGGFNAGRIVPLNDMMSKQDSTKSAPYEQREAMSPYSSKQGVVTREPYGPAGMANHPSEPRLQYFT